MKTIDDIKNEAAKEISGHQALTVREFIELELTYAQQEKLINLVAMRYASACVEDSTRQLREERDKARSNDSVQMDIIRDLQEERNKMHETAETQSEIKSLTHLKELAEKERDSFANDFAVYMEEDRWKYDHAMQKTHSFEEHLEYFKAVYK